MQQALGHHLDIEGLDKEIGSARGNGLAFEDRVINAGHHEKHRMRFLLGAVGVQHAQGVHAGHEHIHQHGVRLAFGNFRNHRHTVLRAGYQLTALGAERTCTAAAKFRGIIGD